MDPFASPWKSNNTQLAVVSQAAIFAIVAVATAMFAFLTGLPSIAQSGMWGLGAYAAALSLQNWDVGFWTSFLFAVGVPVLVAWPTAIISFRTRGTAFLIVTLAFSEFVVLVLQNAPGITGGFNGIGYPDDPSPIGPFKFEKTVNQYYLYLFVLAIAMIVYWLVRRSKFGRRVVAVRDNPELARSLSINVYLHRVVVFEISAAVTGLAGPLILLQQRVITPSLFNTNEFLTVYLMIMLGGMGTIAGPAVGGWIVQLMPQWISTFASISPNTQQLIYGILLLFFVLLARRGVVGQAAYMYAIVLHRYFARAERRAAGSAAPAAPAEPTEARSMPVLESSFEELQGEPVLTVSGLTHSFGANRVLDDLTFDVLSGEIRGLIGPNGSGKTTTLNCISGFLRPDGGDISFRGVPLTGRRVEKISGLGLVRTFQQPEVFETYTPRETCELVLSSVGALGGGRGYNDRLPADVDYYLQLCSLIEVADEPPSSLSYGQTRLLGVAAALARRPYLLMLDEPAAGLSQLDRQRLADVLLKSRDVGVTIIIVDHDMSFLLPLCHRLTVLDYGRMICEGHPRTVCDDEEVIAAYLGSGFAARTKGVSDSRRVEESQR
jgi:branched-chain amino acid transport system permease protein